MDVKSATRVVTAFVARDNRILLLRRSSKVGTYQGKWAGVSGYIEAKSPLEQVLVEVWEELGISAERFSVEAQGAPLEVEDKKNGRKWLVHPFRLALEQGTEPRLDWEHVEFIWAEPKEILDMDTVPGLWEAWCRVCEQV
jgi:8-oxo-dGTP pyrophosphatase MutT (NUDIX family)